MNRAYELNIFFENLKNVLRLNNGITEKGIYILLMEYDIKKSDIFNEVNFNNLFFNWMDYFRQKKNIQVYVSPNQRRFLQFANGYSAGAEYIKFYISLNTKALEEGAKRIFDFMEYNNIEHHSKVSDCVRSDCIVLRIKKSMDARKVAQFINNDEFLLSNAKRTNPFLARYGIIGMAYDNKLSYNSVVSFLVNKYVQDCISNNCADNISVNGFSLFAEEYVNELFSNRDILLNFISSAFAQDDINRIMLGYSEENSLEYYLANIKSVMDLVLHNLKCNDNFEQYISLYEDSISKDTKKRMCFKFLNLLETKEEAVQDSRELLDDFIIYAYYKYDRNMNLVSSYLNFFVESGKYDYITRDNQYRRKFINNLSPQTILNITSGNIENYIERLVKEEINSPYESFMNACVLTLKKYDVSQLSAAIDNGLSGDYNYFTNDNNAREMLYRFVPTNLFKKYAFELASNFDFKYSSIGEAVANVVCDMQKENSKFKKVS